MPIAKATDDLPAGTRYVQVRMDVPGNAVKAVRGRTRALSYAYNAVDRAEKNWFNEFQEIPDWEKMFIGISFSTFGVLVEINDKFAHESIPENKDNQRIN